MNLVEMFTYLDELRESGEVNMFGAAPYLAREAGITKAEARRVCIQWMQTFEERAARAEDQK